MLLLSSIRANDHLFGKLRILDEWLFHMKFMKRAFGEFRKFHKMTTSVGFCLSYDPLKPDFFSFRNELYFNKKMHTDVVNTITYTR